MTARAVRTALLAWYRRNGRKQLPWRTVRSPYRTLVSEFMLAQTQVERVVAPFEAFMTAFGDVAALAQAGTADVLRAWKGLGYNVRAVRLKATAEVICTRHAGEVPRDTPSLRALPGVGAYTAAAIRAFAFNLDDVPIDTNVRRIMHRLNYGLEFPPNASDRDLDALARRLLPPGKAHDWTSALMDLGATVCTARMPECSRCPLQAHCVAAPVDAAALAASRRRHPRRPNAAIPFHRSARYARGRIVDRLRDLPARARISLLDLGAELAATIGERTPEEVAALIDGLERDGLIERYADGLALRES